MNAQRASQAAVSPFLISLLSVRPTLDPSAGIEPRIRFDTALAIDPSLEMAPRVARRFGAVPRAAPLGDPRQPVLEDAWMPGVV